MKCVGRYLFVLLLIPLLLACNAGNEFTEMGEAKGCDVSQATCTVKHGDLAVDLALGPHVVPLESFKVVVTVAGVTVEPNSVIVDYQMKGMDMGMNRYRLIAGEGKWSGTATLPVCTASRMDWIALVEFSSNGKKYRANFPFQTTAQP